jgi:hypothetical protein
MKESSSTLKITHSNVFSQPLNQLFSVKEFQTPAELSKAFRVSHLMFLTPCGFRF